MKLDDFEAVFRSSVKDRFTYNPPSLERVLLITDVDAAATAQLLDKLEQYFTVVAGQEIECQSASHDDYSNIAELLGIISDNNDSDLIVTYRHLNRPKGLRHSLGSYVDTITQATELPVLLLPDPGGASFDRALRTPTQVLVVTDHLQGDDRLVNWGVMFCPARGNLLLAHVEDDATYKRYMDIISMIPDIDTATTIERVRAKLLDRPSYYIETIAEALREEKQEKVTPIVTMGHALRDYKRIVEEHQVDIIVMNTKDEHQLAMHGMAYALSIEIQDRPLLLL